MAIKTQQCVCVCVCNINLKVEPFLVSSLTMTRVDDNTLSADTREVHAAVITTYLSDGTQQPKLHHVQHTHPLISLYALMVRKQKG